MPESIIKVLIKGDEFDLKRATEAARSDLEKVGKSHAGFAKVANVAMASAGAAAVAFLASSVKVAEDFQAAHDRMDNAFRNTGVAGGKWVSDAEAQGQRYGKTRAQIDDALASAVRATGNAALSQRILTAAEDVAVNKHMDLQSATILVTKGALGQSKALKALMIDYGGAAGGAKAVAAAQAGVAKAGAAMNKAHDALLVVEMKVHAGLLKGAAAHWALLAAQGNVAKATDTLKGAYDKLHTTQNVGNKILDLITSKNKGAASDASKTFEGRTQALHAAFTNFQATVGAKVIPILTKLMDYTSKVIVPMLSKVWDWLTKHKAVLIALGLALGAVALAFGAPIVGLALLAAALIYAWNNSEKFRDIVTTTINDVRIVIDNFVNFAERMWKMFGQTIMIFAKTAWNAVKQYISGALEVITAIFNLFKDLFTGKWGKLWGDLLGILKGVWKMIQAEINLALGIVKAILSGAWDAIGGTVHRIWDGIVDYFTKLPGRFVSGLGNLASILTAPFRAAFNAVAGLWNRTIGSLSFSIPSWVPGIGGDGWSAPKIPTLHSGGVYTGGMGGQGLALLRNGEGVFTPEQMRALGGGVSGGTVTINMPAGVRAEDVVRAQRRYDRRNGRA